MIVCSCNHISDKDIHAAVEWMRASDPNVLITAGKVFRALGKSADCGGCMPLFLDTMRRNDKFGVPAELQGLRNPAPRRKNNERRSQGH
jgi:bacterioferritin-associated ferredoxin